MNSVIARGSYLAGYPERLSYLPGEEVSFACSTSADEFSALDLALGLERLYRRPVIDEYDFYEVRYRGDETNSEPPPEIRIEVVLTDLSPEAQRRFAGHLRPWSADTNDFAPPAPDDAAELAGGEWCLPVVFLGRFSPRP